MVGGGQLARMTHQAGIGLGVRFRLLSETADSSAAQVVSDVTVGDVDDLGHAAGLRQRVRRPHVRPRAGADRSPPGARGGGPRRAARTGGLEHAQDKLSCASGSPPTVPRCPAGPRSSSVEDLTTFGERVGWPYVLKAARGGYDGRGVALVSTETEARGWMESALARGVPVLAEERVGFTRELAALVARSPSGQAVAYPVVQTLQVDGICREVVAPAPGLSVEHAVAAQRAALDIAGRLGCRRAARGGAVRHPGGRTRQRAGDAPAQQRSLEHRGCGHSQFEQHLRAVLDLAARYAVPDGAPYSVMVNVLGGDLPEMHSAFRHVLARDPGLHVHVYGKDVQPGRKVGHVTVSGADLDDLLERARHAAAYLTGRHR